MNAAATPASPLEDALLALRLFCHAPAQLGGLSLRGSGPARDRVLALLRERREGQLGRQPPNIDDTGLMGGVDIAASLSAGRTVRQRGLLGDAAGGVLVVPLAERMTDGIAGRLAQALDQAEASERFGMVLLDDGIEPDERPPAALTERIAFLCDLSQVDHLPGPEDAGVRAIAIEETAPLSDEHRAALAATAAALGIVSLRPVLFAESAAKAHAALAGRTEVAEGDLAVAARLVLAPRTRHMPAPEEPAEHQEAPAPEPGDAPETSADPGEFVLDDVVLEAALAAIPADLLARLAAGKAGRQARGSGSGRRRLSGLRGKPLGARPGMPRGGARLALIDTLRAAVPWQGVRREELSEGDARLVLRRDDLRVRRFEERAGRVTIFCVDASGSAAAARLAEAKGAVELMLAQAYSTRSEVALIAFRGSSADVLLPPTRSLTRARRALGELPGGGGTPLAAGLHAARDLAEAVELRGRTPHLVILTDGRGNIAADGSASRSAASADVEAAAKSIAARGIETLLVDISARTGPAAPQLASALQARFLALPMADARTLHAALGTRAA